MSKFLTDTRNPIGMVVFSFHSGNEFRIENASLWNKVNTVEDFCELEEDIEAKYKNKSSSYHDFNIINIIYF
ncbi:MAG: hypothetical protein IJW05_12100 [Lentisphaeria bacterium]|nr:hypothetical protein [Lentisphaeria bacterium]